MTRDELRALIASEVVDTSGAMKLLGCTRQNIDRLVKNGKLVPIAEYSKTKLFLRADILERLKDLEPRDK